MRKLNNKRKVIITFLDYGQLGNRLFLLAHLLAFAKEANMYLVVFNFYEFYSSFNLRNNKYCYFINNKILQTMLWPMKKIILFSIKKEKKYAYDLNLLKNGFSPIKIINKWKIVTQRIDKNLSLIKSVFQFKSEDEKIVNKIINSFNASNNKKIIGVHLRRGDYKYWANGKYYFSLEQYSQLIKYIGGLFGNEVLFILCSDERLSKEKLFIKDVDFYISGLTAVQDLLLLSKCDYIVGPPSTFNAWASFIGRKPLYTIKRINHYPNLSDFKVNQGNISSLTYE